MKYIIELEKIYGTNLYKAKGCNTLVFDEKGIERILTPYEEEPKREIDWNKVPKDTKVYVGNFKNEEKTRRYYAGYVDEKHLTYSAGATSWSSDTNVMSWNYCKLAEEPKKEWYK